MFLSECINTYLLFILPAICVTFFYFENEKLFTFMCQIIAYHIIIIYHKVLVRT